jgi:ATP-dependent RNA helicase SUPV3L1/SUV3
VTAASGAGAAGAVTPIEPATTEVPKDEEVWRPRRHPRAERRQGAPRHHRGRDRGAGHRRAGQGPGDTQQTPAVSEEVAAGTSAAAAPAVSPAAERPAEHRHHDRHERQHGDRDRNRRPQHEHGGRKDEDRHGREAENRNGRQGEKHHGKPRWRDEPRRGPQVITAAPPKPAAADTSSPFAALAALKAIMEKRSEGSGSS